MKKKIMILSLEKGYGGVETQVATLANSLIDLYDIYLFFLKDTNEYLKIDSKVKVIVKDKKIFNKKKYYTDLFKNIDVVISTSLLFNRYVIKCAKGKTIYWEHNNLSIKHYNIKYIKDYNQIVVPNPDLYNIYLKYNNNISIINNAIDLPSVENSLESNNIVFVGKLAKNKKVDELIEIFSQVRKKIDVNLFIVGEGEERKNLENFIKINDISNVYFRGSLNKEEIEEVFMSSSLYVTCSEDESFGSSVLEAMSYGIPIVAFDNVKTFSLFVVDDINGYLISNRDKEDMKNKIIKIMSDSNLRKDFGNCAKEKALEFDINSVKREWIKII